MAKRKNRKRNKSQKIVNSRGKTLSRLGKTFKTRAGKVIRGIYDKSFKYWIGFITYNHKRKQRKIGSKPRNYSKSGMGRIRDMAYQENYKRDKGYSGYWNKGGKSRKKKLYSDYKMNKIQDLAYEENHRRDKGFSGYWNKKRKNKRYTQPKFYSNEAMGQIQDLAYSEDRQRYSPKKVLNIRGMF